MTDTPTLPPMSPTTLAAMLGSGLVALVLLLGILAPSEVIVDLERLDQLVADGVVERLEVSPSEIIAQLSEPVIIQDAGQRMRAQAVLVPRATVGGEAAVERWRAAGAPVVNVAADAGRRLREALWGSAVAGLLLFGVYHLVQQARRHRREGSPRQHLAEVQQQLDDGHITREEYERQVAEISPEL